eukprot:8303850-Lingulodinium_polyedra.AAC.1
MADGRQLSKKGSWPTREGPPPCVAQCSNMACGRRPAAAQPTAPAKTDNLTFGADAAVAAGIIGANSARGAA